jgi:hypothetical protein
MDAIDFGKFVFVKCTVYRGAFSDERVFEVPEAEIDDQTGYTGVAPLHYFQKQDANPFSASEPAPGQNLPGMLAARMISNGGDKARVAIPDGEGITVPLALLAKRTHAPHVSL